MRKILLLCMTIGILMLSGCNSSVTQELQSPEVFEPVESQVTVPQMDMRVVEHAFGTTEIPVEPQRIVSVYLEDMLLALDVPIKLAITIGEENYLSEEMESRGIATAAAGDAINYEMILEQEPDLIVTMDAITQEQYEQLNKIAPTIAFSRRSWQDSLPKLGAALGLEAEAEQYLADHTQFVADAQEQLSSILADNPTAAVLRSTNKTLRVYFPNVLSAELRQGYVTVLYEDLGFGLEDYLGELQQTDPDRENAQISMEILPQIQAGYLFVIVGGAGNTAEAQQQDMSDFEETAQSAIWANLPAVQNGRVFYLDARYWISDGPLADKMKINQVLELLTAA